jgi:two-component system chemotaxis response regulator CheB
MVLDDHVVLGHGARENGHRPSHDAMMRSAAVSRGARTVGVVITGLLDDGAVGMRTIDRYGGACLVQSPEDAAFPDMPASALRAVPTAGRVPLSDLAGEVARVLKEDPCPSPTVSDEQRALDDAEIASALGRDLRLPNGDLIGDPSAFACPSCHGVLNTVPDEGLRYRCRTGHSWTAESLLAEQDVGIESALWAALRALEERADLADRMLRRAREQGRDWSVEHYAHSRDEARRAAESLRPLLASSLSPPEPLEPSA